MAVNYDSLATQFGGTEVPSSAVNLDSLAAQFGGVEVSAAPAAKPPAAKAAQPSKVPWTAADYAGAAGRAATNLPGDVAQLYGEMLATGRDVVGAVMPWNIGATAQNIGAIGQEAAKTVAGEIEIGMRKLGLPSKPLPGREQYLGELVSRAEQLNQTIGESALAQAVRGDFGPLLTSIADRPAHAALNAAIGLKSLAGVAEKAGYSQFAANLTKAASTIDPLTLPGRAGQAARVAAAKGAAATTGKTSEFLQSAANLPTIGEVTSNALAKVAQGATIYGQKIFDPQSAWIRKTYGKDLPAFQRELGKPPIEPVLGITSTLGERGLGVPVVEPVAAEAELLATKTPSVLQQREEARKVAMGRHLSPLSYQGLQEATEARDAASVIDYGKVDPKIVKSDAQLESLLERARKAVAEAEEVAGIEGRSFSSLFDIRSEAQKAYSAGGPLRAAEVIEGKGVVSRTTPGTGEVKVVDTRSAAEKAYGMPLRTAETVEGATQVARTLPAQAEKRLVDIRSAVDRAYSSGGGLSTAEITKPSTTVTSKTPDVTFTRDPITGQMRTTGAYDPITGKRIGAPSGVTTPGTTTRQVGGGTTPATAEERIVDLRSAIQKAYSSGGELTTEEKKVLETVNRRVTPANAEQQLVDIRSALQKAYGSGPLQIGEKTTSVTVGGHVRPATAGVQYSGRTLSQIDRALGELSNLPGSTGMTATRSQSLKSLQSDLRKYLFQEGKLPELGRAVENYAQASRGIDRIKVAEYLRNLVSDIAEPGGEKKFIDYWREVRKGNAGKLISDATGDRTYSTLTGKNSLGFTSKEMQRFEDVAQKIEQREKYERYARRGAQADIGVGEPQRAIPHTLNTTGMLANAWLRIHGEYLSKKTANKLAEVMTSPDNKAILDAFTKAVERGKWGEANAAMVKALSKKAGKLTGETKKAYATLEAQTMRNFLNPRIENEENINALTP